MKHLSLLAALILMSACGGSGPDNTFPDIPTLEIGGSGARFMTDASTPYAAYSKAYGQMKKLHFNVQRNHAEFGNPLAVRVALERILRNLKVMQMYLVSPDPSTLDPIIAFYDRAVKLAQRGQLSGLTVQKVEIYRRKIKLGYGPANASLKGVSGTKKEVAKNPNTKMPVKDGDALPPPVENKDETTSDVPKTDKTESPKKDEPKKVVKKDNRSAITYRIFFKAWQKSHEDLASAYAKKGDTKSAYEEVVEALRGLKVSLSAKDKDRLRVYVSFYEKISEDTKAFTIAPEGGSDKDVLNDLRIVQGGIQKDFDPAKRK